MKYLYLDYKSCAINSRAEAIRFMAKHTGHPNDFIIFNGEIFGNILGFKSPEMDLSCSDQELVAWYDQPINSTDVSL